MKNILYIVIPCYNEEEVLLETTKRLDKKLKTLIKNKKIDKNSKVLYVNDGSKDNTLSIIEKISKENKLFTGISLAKNVGHQNALMAGLMEAKEKADIIISMDADLQDDINAIDEMIDKYYKGNQIVYGVRSSRKRDTFFKKHTAQLYYKLLKFMGVNIIYNHADFRLTTKRVLEELSKYHEKNLFLRGIFPLLGFKYDIVYYERNERFAGSSKYPLKKMLHLAFDGITSFSTKPLHLIMMLGFTIAFLSFLYLVYAIIVYFNGNTVSGWATIITLICLFSGIQIFCLGLIGEYIGKIYIETKNRPLYIIEKRLDNEENN